MIVVIIAGGSGTRLWPLSTPDYPKHLLKVGKTDKSLLQATYERAKQLSDNVYVASEASHIEHVKEQLPELPAEAFIVEPDRRGTANSITLALAYIAQRHDGNEPIASIHADHYIRDGDGFKHSLEVAAEAATKNQRLVLVGVEPNYPATQFGYIEKGELFDEGMFIYNVQSFKEKPDFETAQHYLESGKYLWNCGYFVGSVEAFKQKMQEYAPGLLKTYEQLAKVMPDKYDSVYLGLEPEAIDYALIEKVKDLLVVPASFDWMDLGSFIDLHGAVDKDEQGNHANGQVELEGVTNSYVHNKEAKPVVVIGLDDVVVVNTSKGIVVARKDLSQKVGDVSKRLLNGN